MVTTLKDKKHNKPSSNQPSPILQSGSIDSCRSSISMSETDQTIQKKKKKNQQDHKHLQDENEDIEHHDPSSFSSYPIALDTQKCLLERGITQLFPIQQKTYHAIFQGKHVIGRARTGTGKTLAFALPVVESLRHYGRFSKKVCRVLVLLPTRELAQQVATEFQNLSQNNKLYNSATVVGGLPEDPQIRAIRQGAHVVIGTPGRVLDFIKRDIFDLKKLRILVLDEADQMLEMGFKEDVDAVLQSITSSKNKTTTQSDIQLLLFTATLPPWVSKIAETYMQHGEKVIIDVVKNEQVSTPSGILHLSILCGFHQRAKVLGNVITHYAGVSGRCIVFVETKANANDISMNSDISHFCQVLHGDIPQKQRETTLRAFKEGKFRCLVATDVAARGLHVDNIELVVQLEPPKDVETFIHRSGRTGRAGAKGVNIVFHNPMNAPFLKTIEAATGIRFTRVGIPQTEQLIASETLHVVDKVLQQHLPSDIILARCKEATDKLLKTFTPQQAISLLILEIAGLSPKGCQSKVVYSALTGAEGYKTFSLTINSGIKIQSKNYIWQVLKNGVGIDQTTLNLIQSMTMRADASGALFDVPQNKLDYFESCVASAMKNPKNQDSFTIQVVFELPELNDSRLVVHSAPSMNNKNPFARGGKRQRTDGFPSGLDRRSKWQR